MPRLRAGAGLVLSATTGVLVSALVVAPAAGVMVSFESDKYAAGEDFLGVDGWTYYSAATTTITPDEPFAGDTRVLEGSQSARIWGNLSMVARPFDAGPTGYDSGTKLSTRMMVDGASGSGGFYLSRNLATLSRPGGIVGNAGGNFELFGRVGAGGGEIDTGIAFLTNTDYLLEMELDLASQSFEAFATNLTAAGPRTPLGTAMFARTVSASSYTTGGFCFINRGAVVLFDEVDISVVPGPSPDPELSREVDFEAPVYVAGRSALGVDGWHDFGGATAVVTSDALSGQKSLKVSGSRSIIYRHFGSGTTYDDGTVLTASMMADGSSPTGGRAEFFFSHAPEDARTPGGIIGFVGGNFFVFGLRDGKIVSPVGIDTDVPFLTDVEYLLEVELDLTNQTFDSYVTNLTTGEERISLGTAGLWTLDGGGNPVVIPAGDDTTGGWIIVTRNGAVATYDDLTAGVPPPDLLGDANGDGKVNDKDAANLAAHWGETGAVDGSVPEPSALVLLLGLAFGAEITRRRRTA